MLDGACDCVVTVEKSDDAAWLIGKNLILKNPEKIKNTCNLRYFLYNALIQILYIFNAFKI